MARRCVIALALSPIVVLAAGCLPFFGGKGPPPRTPEAVLRFASTANALGVPPAPPSLPEATHLMASAVESLPNAPAARGLGPQIDAQAQAMHDAAPGDEGHGRQSIALAVQALQSMRKPAGNKKERERALNDAREAISVYDGYRALARALITFTGGQPDVPAGSALPVIVARIAVEEDDMARRTGAEAVLAIGAALRAQGVDAGDLDKRAAQLAGATALEYAAGLHDALHAAVDALHKLKADAAAFRALADEARAAVERISGDRPFALQRPAVQDALRLIADALTVASRSVAGGR